MSPHTYLLVTHTTRGDGFGLVQRRGTCLCVDYTHTHTLVTHTTRDDGFGLVQMRGLHTHTLVTHTRGDGFCLVERRGTCL